MKRNIQRNWFMAE